MMKVLAVFLFVLAAMGAAAGTAYVFLNKIPVPNAERPVIQYTDATGKMYFVDSTEKVPEEYRSTMRDDLPSITRGEFKIPEPIVRPQVKNERAKARPKTCPLQR